MKATLKFLILPFLFTWELPQNLLGMMVYVIMMNRKNIINTEKEAPRLFIETPDTGVSLGCFVFWSKTGNRFPHLTNDCRMHEYGHALQSVMLGPVYLILVGIPSLSRVVYSKWYFKKYGRSWKNYFNGFPENWADKLGGVIIPKG
jgi:hypothetical protein